MVGRPFNLAYIPDLAFRLLSLTSIPLFFLVLPLRSFQLKISYPYVCLQLTISTNSISLFPFYVIQEHCHVSDIRPTHSLLVRIWPRTYRMIFDIKTVTDRSTIYFWLNKAIYQAFIDF